MLQLTLNGDFLRIGIGRMMRKKREIGNDLRHAIHAAFRECGRHKSETIFVIACSTSPILTGSANGKLACRIRTPTASWAVGVGYLTASGVALPSRQSRETG